MKSHSSVSSAVTFAKSGGNQSKMIRCDSFGAVSKNTAYTFGAVRTRVDKYKKRTARLCEARCSDLVESLTRIRRDSGGS